MPSLPCFDASRRPTVLTHETSIHPGDLYLFPAFSPPHNTNRPKASRPLTLTNSRTKEPLTQITTNVTGFQPPRSRPVQKFYRQAAARLSRPNPSGPKYRDVTLRWGAFMKLYTDMTTTHSRPRTLTSTSTGSNYPAPSFSNSTKPATPLSTPGAYHPHPRRPRLLAQRRGALAHHQPRGFESPPAAGSRLPRRHQGRPPGHRRPPRLAQPLPRHLSLP